MAYKIAVASSDGKNIDLSFGAAAIFDIYDVEQTEYCFSEKRYVHNEEENICGENKQSCGSGCLSKNSCGAEGGNFPKVEMLSDCRCIVCKKIGFNITRQLEKKAITGFDVECSVNEALDKIVNYFDKIDNHRSLRAISSN